MSATHVNDQSFKANVLDKEGTVLVDFWAPWCGPCRSMSGLVDELADEVSDRASVVKVNVDESAAAAEMYGVASIPSFMVVRNGDVKERFSGVVSKQRLLEALEPHLN